MRLKYFITAISVALCVSIAVSTTAQVNQSATGQSTSAPPEEIKLGGYVAAGSIEAGYRFVDVSGASFPCNSSSTGLCNYTGMYDTFEDLGQGPRVFDQTLSLRSSGQTGVLFDNMFFSSFGWGGDPENVARLRLNKKKVYNLAVLFRRDYQRFDFNLLANPLNPASSTPNIPVLNSPHMYDTVRRMTDVNLTLAPASRFSVRLGYNRIRFDGPSLSTFHMPIGTDINPTQANNYTNNGFRAGVDIKVIPRTTLSFDGIVNWFKNDTALNLLNFPLTVAGLPANEGISWNTLANQPCRAALVGTPACNVAFSFFRQDRYRSTAPNVRASLESHYWRKVDFSARATYGWSDLDSTFLQNWTGFVRGSNAQSVANDPIRNRRITSDADFGATLHLSDHVRLTNTFRFVNLRMPMFATNIVATTPASNAVTPTGPPAAVGTGIVRGLFNDTKLNETVLDFDLGRHAGVNVGYRYTHRTIDLTGEAFDVDVITGERTSPVEPGEAGFDLFRIPEHTGLGGIWFAPSEKFRLNFDAEFSSAGITYETPSDTGTSIDTFTGATTFTRITPRHSQQYRARATFQPMRHVSMAASANIWEQRNSLQDIQYRFHNRNYGFNADITPNERLLIDLAYNYQDFLQNDLICYVASGTPATGGFPGSVVAASSACPADPAYLGTLGDYGSQVHFGSIMFRVKPVKRVTFSTGYSIVSTDGNFTQINALQPFSPVQYNYHRPLAALEIEFAKGLAVKGGWNFYDYNEKGSTTTVFGSGGPTIPRDFHANTGSISLRYSF